MHLTIFQIWLVVSVRYIPRLMSDLGIINYDETVSCADSFRPMNTTVKTYETKKMTSAASQPCFEIWKGIVTGVSGPLDNHAAA